MSEDVSSPLKTTPVKYGRSGKKHYGKFDIIVEDRQPNKIRTTVWGESEKEVKETIKKYLKN